MRKINYIIISILFSFLFIILYSSLDNERIYNTKDLIGKKISQVEINLFQSNETINTEEFINNEFTILNFWASWCAPCKKAFPALCEIQNEYLEKDVVVVGVNVDKDKSSMEKFLRKNNHNFKIFFDIDKNLVSELNVKTMPTTFIVDKNFKIIAEKQGYFKKTKSEIKSILDKLIDEK